MIQEESLSARLRKESGEAIERAYTKLMRPRLIEAGFSKREVSRIIFRPPVDFDLFSTGTVTAHITADAWETEVSAIVEAAAERFGGTAPTRDTYDEMTTLTTRFQLDGVDVDMWGVIEHHETGASK